MPWTAPKTWAVGDPAVASDLNTYIRDNSNYLYGDSVWTTATLQNGWAPLGSGTFAPGYRHDGAHVELRGAAAGGTTTAGTLLFTLPSGYRPQNTVYGSGIAAGSGLFVFNISTAGAVQIQAGSGLTNVTFDNTRFSVLP